MKTAIVLFACVATVLCLPTPEELIARRALPALEHEEVHDNLGQYELRYITAEGTIVSERGRLVPNADGTDQVLIYEGEYTYIGDDGKTYVTRYVTDSEGGHRVVADHLPVAPVPEPVPAAV